MRRLGLSPGQMISSLRQRNYRLFFFGQLVSVAGWAGQAIGARWALVVGGLATLACGVMALPALTRIDRRPAADAPPAPAARALAK